MSQETTIESPRSALDQEGKLNTTNSYVVLSAFSRIEAEGVICHASRQKGGSRTKAA